MIKVDEIIVVEGKYDRQALLRVVDGVIIETGGFRIFKDKELIEALKSLAQSHGLIILTDSDAAGFVIRNKIHGVIGKKYIKDAYIPDVPGKERRKDAPSKEGLLGVEGMPEEVILQALTRAGVKTQTTDEQPKNRIKYTKTDMYRLGLSGRENSAEKRRELAKKLSLPAHLSANRLLELLNIIGWDENT